MHDSLKLVLDRNHTIQLREKGGRIVANCSFKYEDYELHGNKLEVKLENYNHFHPDRNQLYITATDVNGLILKDAKATILVKTNTIRETFQPLVILSDTLKYAVINLDPDRATVYDIPSQLFQKTNTLYDIHVSVLNSENQRMEYSTQGIHYFSQYEITSRFSNDSIIYDVLKNGVSMQALPVKIQRDEEIELKQVMLPYKEKINPVISRVRLQGDLVSKEIRMHNLVPKLELIGGIQKDSFKIELLNPQKLEVSWYVYRGSLLLQKGFGKDIEYKTLITERGQTYYVELLYSFGGQANIKRKDFEFKEDRLFVSLDIPEKVYPGQKVEATIQVNDQLGHPVSGVDLTALAVTTKLNYNLPDLPYYGSHSTPRSKKDYYGKSDLNKSTVVLNLDYKRWQKLARLDTMKYYQLIYPGNQPFRYSVDISDSTQFAPYVIQGGSAKQIYVIEVNRKPVYYSWVDQPQAYSFYVSPKQKNEISLRLFDRVLVLDSLSFEEGKKTILSIDLDHLPKSVKVYQLFTSLNNKKDKNKSNYPTFTKTELERHISYISSFRYSEGRTFLELGKEFVPLFSENIPSYRAIIAGPVTPGKQTYYGYPSSKITYQHTGGFNYAFEDNIVYKSDVTGLIPERLIDRSYSPMINLNDRVMTKKLFLEKQKYTPGKWHTRVIDMIDHLTRVQVFLPVDKEASGIAAVVFENCKTKQRIFPCRDYSSHGDQFKSFPLGLHNLFVIYNSGKYLKMDSIHLQSYKNIVVDLNNSKLNSKDSFSKSLFTLGFKNCYDAPRTPSKITSFKSLAHGIGNVRGRIYGEDKDGLPGVSILVKGTTIGTVTNEDGYFSLDIPNYHSILVASFIGYFVEEVEVQVGADVSLQLRVDMQTIDEVVVTGYTTERKKDLVGSVVVRAPGLSISLPEEKEKIENNVPELKEDREAEQQLYKELLTLNHIRSNFSDVGFWEPKLFTDRNGQAKFTIAFPEDITRWEATVYAMNKQLKTGTVRKSIKSYKPIMAELHVPQFLTQGDSALFLGKVLNYTSDKTITGRVNWSGANTDFEKNIQFAAFHTEKLPVKASPADSVTTRYFFTRDDGYLDGEERTIPVIEQGVIRAEGTLSILKNNDQLHIKASEREHVTVEILDNQLDIYVGEVNYLLNYQYACNEQLASKLIGLVNHKLLMRYEGKPYKYDRDVDKIISRLLKNQNGEFLWSWWNVSSNTSYWMSAHILRALKAAKDAGYTVRLDIENIARKASYKFEFLRQYDYSDADLLHALASWGANLNYMAHIQKLDSICWIRENIKDKYRKEYYQYSCLKEKLLLLETRQMMKLPYQIDSLLKYKKEGIMGENFFTDNKPAYYWYNDQLAANAIAYRIVKRDSLQKNLLIPMQLYFLSQKKKGEWNTYESSNVLMTLLPDLIAAGASKQNAATVKLSGEVNETINKFPSRVDLQPNEELHIQKESGLPIYYMQYRKERVTEAKSGVEGFEIKTFLGNGSMNLEAGKPTPLTVEVNVKKDVNVENVMIEVPIPAACSYADKTQSYNGVESHREYFKERTVIFCDHLKAGKYTFVIQLLPRFTGKFIVNPAQVSLMYVPVVNANNDMKVVVVE